MSIPQTRPDASPDAAPDLHASVEPDVTGPRLRLTPSAVQEIRSMMEEEDLLDAGGLRITATTGAGCATPLRFGLVLEVEREEDDMVLEGQGIRLFIDPRSAWSVDGLEVDWVDAPGLGEGFAFRHPRGAGGRCG